jgi:O-antigen ligase
MSTHERTYIAQRLDLGRSWPFAEGSVWYLCTAALALLIGAVAASRPELALAGAVALVLAPLVFANAIAGLSILLFLSFLDNVSGATGAVSLTKIVGLLLIVGWIASAATSRLGERRRAGLLSREPALSTALIVFTAWVAISLVWAESPSSGVSALLRFVFNFALFPIALVAVTKRRHMVLLFCVFIAGALVSIIIALANGSAGAAAGGRLEGAGLNPNQIGMLLVVAIVLAFTLAANRAWSTLARVVAVAAAVGAAIGLFSTLSRGALVGLGASMLVAPFVVGRGGAVAVAVVTIVGTVSWFAAIAPQSAVDRVTHPGREGGSGREELWRVGWRMVNAHPVQGVGAGNFPVSSIHYVLRPGSTQDDRMIVDLRLVPHNIYLAVLSELGIIGLLLFAAVIVLALTAGIRAARVFAWQGDATMELLTRGLLIAVMGYLVALFFSSQLYAKQVWLLLALGPALFAIAKNGLPGETSRSPRVKGHDEARSAIARPVLARR